MKNEIFRLGLETFQDKEKFKRWLSKPNSSLGGAIPCELIRNNPKEIINCLNRINYGNYA